jgi:hypothetical protein
MTVASPIAGTTMHEDKRHNVYRVSADGTEELVTGLEAIRIGEVFCMRDAEFPDEVIEIPTQLDETVSFFYGVALDDGMLDTFTEMYAMRSANMLPLQGIIASHMCLTKEEAFAYAASRLV